MSYLIYLRKSRADLEAEAHGEGETLARHKEALTALARRQHLTIGAIYSEVCSGETIASRPQMQRLLSEVEQGVWEGVLVMEVERLARGDTIDQGIVAQAFKFSDTKIVTPTKTYDPNNEFDEEYFEFGLFMSRREYKTINRRLQRGRLASVQEGKYVASRPPYGYRKVKLEHEKGYTLEPVPEEAAVVQMIFDLCVNGEDGERFGGAKICRRLNQLHIPPNKGEIWVPSSVYDILRNPIYNGKIRWNWRPVNKSTQNGKITASRPRNTADNYTLVEGRHEAIVSDALFQRAQELVNHEPMPRVRGDKAIKNPLAGLVVCEKCGRKMIRRREKTGSDYLLCAVPSCSNVASRLDLVEKRIIESLKKWVSDYSLKSEAILQGQNHSRQTIEAAIQNLEKEAAEVEKQMNRLYDLLERGVYDDDTFIRRSAVLKEKSERLQTQKLELERQIQEIERGKEVNDTVIPRMKYVIEIYNNLWSVQEKNELLKEVLEKVTYRKEKSASYRGVDPEDFEITIYPRMPKQ